MNPITVEDKQRAFAELKEAKTLFASRGWFPATSGNLSVRAGEFAEDNFTFAITASGKDKSVSTPEDFLLVDAKGQLTELPALSLPRKR